MVSYFSIIVPTYKRHHSLSLCLSQLDSAFQSIDVPYEVIVTDDDKEGSARRNLEDTYPWVRWIQGPGKGPAANRNNGAAHANSQWLVFTDDDCLPDASWLSAFKEIIQSDQHVQVLEGKTVPIGERFSLDEAAPVNLKGGFLWSCNFAIKKHAFELLHGFDEAFPHACMEDVDFADRIVEASLPVIFVEKALVGHPWRKAKKSWDDGSGGEVYYPALAYYLSKHPDKHIQHTTKRYLRDTVREFLHETLPGIFRYKCRGLRYSIGHHLYQLRLAMRVRKFDQS